MKRSTRDAIKKTLSVTLYGFLTLGLSVAVYLGTLSFSERTVKLVSSSEKCDPRSCTFSIQVKNTSSSTVNAYAQIDLFKVIGRLKSGTYSLERSELIHFTLDPTELKEVKQKVTTEFLVVHYEISVGESRASM